MKLRLISRISRRRQIAADRGGLVAPGSARWIVEGRTLQADRKSTNWNFSRFFRKYGLSVLTNWNFSRTFPVKRLCRPNSKK
jgi:hypothetical protein